VDIQQLGYNHKPWRLSVFDETGFSGYNARWTHYTRCLLAGAFTMISRRRSWTDRQKKALPNTYDNYGVTLTLWQRTPAITAAADHWPITTPACYQAAAQWLTSNAQSVALRTSDPALPAPGSSLQWLRRGVRTAVGSSQFQGSRSAISWDV